MAHRSKFLNKIRSVLFVIFSTLLITPAQAEIPDALYSALGLDKDVAPNVLYDALVTRYRDPEQGAGEGAFADLWEPIPFSAYMAPQNFYEGPDLDMEVSRTECVECHENVTPGWVHSWENSVHGNLDEIRGLDETDSRHYKKELIGQVETNLHSMGLLTGSTSLWDLARCWFTSWVGNLAGAILLAAIFVIGGGGLILATGDEALLYKVATKKMHGTAPELFAKAILCNWLVCLALWSSARARDDITKCVLIFWCLYAFIATGFEHSVANMTVFAVALLSDHPDGISVAGAIWNLIWVTLGNTFSGAVIMGVGYWCAASRPSFSDTEIDESSHAKAR